MWDKNQIASKWKSASKSFVRKLESKWDRERRLFAKLSVSVRLPVVINEWGTNIVRRIRRKNQSSNCIPPPPEQLLVVVGARHPTAPDAFPVQMESAETEILGDRFCCSHRCPQNDAVINWGIAPFRCHWTFCKCFASGTITTGWVPIETSILIKLLFHNLSMDLCSIIRGLVEACDFDWHVYLMLRETKVWRWIKSWFFFTFGKWQHWLFFFIVKGIKEVSKRSLVLDTSRPQGDLSVTQPTVTVIHLVQVD